jgi:hypothetical protein
VTRIAQRTALAVLVGLVATGTLILVGAPAQAAGSGGLTFIPAKGMDISPMYAVTPGPCPAQATNLIGRIYGKGFPAAGVVVIPNSDADVRHDAGFGVPLQDTIASFAAEAGVRLQGPYKITVQCVNELATKVFSQFSGNVTFGNATHFTAPAPKVPPADGVPVGFLAQVFPEFKQGSVPASAAAGAAPAASGATTADGAASSARASSSITSTVRPFVIIVLIAALVGGLGFLATGRRQNPSADTAKGRAARVEWPDDEKKPEPDPINSKPDLIDSKRAD